MTDNYQRFVGAHTILSSPTLNKNPGNLTETSVNIYQPTPRHITEDSNLQLRGTLNSVLCCRYDEEGINFDTHTCSGSELQ